MEKKMLYLSFFSACAGIMTCMYNVFNSDMSWTNLILFVFFCAIAMCLAKIDANIKHQEEQDLARAEKREQNQENWYKERD